MGARLFASRELEVIDEAQRDRSSRQESDKSRYDLLRRFVDQPVAGTLDDHALDLIGDETAVLNEEFPRDLLAGQH
jgi:hypothetical protein